MLAGVPVAYDEVTDVNFALIAMQLNREARGAKLKRLKQRGTRSLLFVGLVLVVLNFLFCVAYVLLNLAQQATPLSARSTRAGRWRRGCYFTSGAPSGKDPNSPVAGAANGPRMR